MLNRALFANRRDRVLSTAALATIAACTVVITSMVCTAQPQPNNNASAGQARVVERNGPEIDVAANGQGGQVVVLFPSASGGGNQAAGDVEVVLVESQMPAPAAPAADGQAQQTQGNQQPTPTGREFLFTSRDASDGVVRHTLEAGGGGGGRRFKILARVGSEYVQAQQIGNHGNVSVFLVTRPVQQQQQQQQQPTDAAAQAPAGGEQQGQGDQQQQQQQQSQQQQPQMPAPAAIIMLYAGASGS